LCCDAVRLPADELPDQLHAAMASTPHNGTLPTTALGTVPSNDTVVSNDTVLCGGDELALDVSSQSVEIITSEESNLLELDLHMTSDVTAASHDLGPDTEGEFMTARFYIGESEPATPTKESAAAATAAAVEVSRSRFRSFPHCEL